MSDRASFSAWVEEYKLADRERRLQIKAGSPLVGKNLEKLNLRGAAGANIISIERNRGLSAEILRPTAKTELKADDILVIDLSGPDNDIGALQTQFGLEDLPLSGAYFADRSQELGMAEAIAPPTSELVGKTIIEAELRTRFGFTALGLRRGDGAHTDDFLAKRLKVGDTLLIIGSWKEIERFRADTQDLVVIKLPVEID